MKKFLLLLPLIFLSFAPHAFASFGYSQAVTIQHAKVPNTDQTNFPIDVDVTQAGLKSTGNLGHVQNANGYDIWFYSDSACTTRIPAERDIYNASTGRYTGWVQKTVLTASDVTIYICYGDASISTDPNLDGTFGATSVWDANYKVVYHTGDGSTVGLNDSTSNALTLTNNSTVASAGKIGGAVDSSSSTWLSRSDSALPTGSTAFTISGWYKTTTVSTSNIILNWGAGGATNQSYLGIYNLGNGFNAGIVGNGTANVGDNVSLNDGVWHYIVGTQSGAGGTNTKIYVDGSLKNSGALTWALASGGANKFTIGRDNAASPTQTYTGSQDELRISSGLARPADWIATEYNNQSATSTFYTLGSETALSTFNFWQYWF